MSGSSVSSESVDPYDDYFEDDIARIVGGDKEDPVEDNSSATSEDSIEALEEEAPAEPAVNPESTSGHNKIIIVLKPEDRRTSHTMSSFEMTELKSIRATQISQYNNCMVPTDGLDDPVKMAEREIMMRMSPLIIRRHLGDMRDAAGVMRSYYEFWNPNEMVFPRAYANDTL